MCHDISALSLLAAACTTPIVASMAPAHTVQGAPHMAACALQPFAHTLPPRAWLGALSNALWHIKGYAVQPMMPLNASDMLAASTESLKFGNDWLNMKG